MNKTYKISEVSNITGLSIPTLRFYERLKLIKPKRNSNNYRLFTEDDINWIQFIKRIKETGMSLDKIINYSKLREKGNSTINERILLLKEQEQLLYEERDKIQKHIDFLKKKTDYYNKLKNNT